MNIQYITDAVYEIQLFLTCTQDLGCESAEGRTGESGPRCSWSLAQPFLSLGILNFQSTTAEERIITWKKERTTLNKYYKYCKTSPTTMNAYTILWVIITLNLQWFVNFTYAYTVNGPQTNKRKKKKNIADMVNKRKRANWNPISSKFFPFFLFFLSF